MASANVNHFVGAGNLVSDPGLSTTTKGTPVVNFRMAINTYIGKDNQETLYIDATAYGGLAELLASRTQKGTNVFVTGRLGLDQWKDKDSGEPRSKYYIKIDHARIISGRSGEDTAEEEF